MPKIGDYCLFCKWTDCLSEDRWHVGVLKFIEIDDTGKKHYYCQENKCHFRYCKKISPDVGDKLIRNGIMLEKNHIPFNVRKLANELTRNKNGWPFNSLHKTENSQGIHQSNP